MCEVLGKVNENVFVIWLKRKKIWLNVRNFMVRWNNQLHKYKSISQTEKPVVLYKILQSIKTIKATCLFTSNFLLPTSSLSLHYVSTHRTFLLGVLRILFYSLKIEHFEGYVIQNTSRNCCNMEICFVLNPLQNPCQTWWRSENQGLKHDTQLLKH